MFFGCGKHIGNFSVFLYKRGVHKYRPLFYRRVRLFCQLTVRIVSLATGVSESRIAQIETGRREPNPTEARLIESFLRAKLKMILESEGPIPDWMARANDRQEHHREIPALEVGAE